MYVMVRWGYVMYGSHGSDGVWGGLTISMNAIRVWALSFIYRGSCIHFNMPIVRNSCCMDMGRRERRASFVLPSSLLVSCFCCILYIDCNLPMYYE